MQDVDSLSSLNKLTHLSLLENPVAKNPDFRCAIALASLLDEGRLIIVLKLLVDRVGTRGQIVACAAVHTCAVLCARAAPALASCKRHQNGVPIGNL